MKEKNAICKKSDIIFALLLCLFTVWQVYRAPYGLDRCDESFYLTVPYRFLQGDVPILHEWHLSQLSGIVLTPVMWVYTLLGGGGEGIILNFRYIYVGFQSLAAVIIYLLLRKKSPLGALLASVVFLPFSPYYIMALSYYSMGIGFLTLAGLITACCTSKLGRAAAGIVFALSVLCCPYLVLAYAAVGIIILICTLKSGDKTAAGEFGIFTLGAAAVAAAVAVMILPKAGVSGIIKAIPCILNDPEHSSMTVLHRTGMFFRHLLFSRKISFVTSFSAVIIIALALHDKKRVLHRRIYVSAAAVVTIGFIVMNCVSYSYINFFMLPLCILGAVCYVTDEYRDKGVFRYVYLAGWAYAYLMILSSNNFYESLTSSLTVASVAGAFFAGKAAQQMLTKDTEPKTLVSAFLSVSCAVLLCAVLVVNKNAWARGTYSDFSVLPVKMLDYTIEEGPAKGLITYDNEYVRYSSVYEQAEIARKAKGDNILYLTHNCYLYLADDKRASGYSGWLSLDYEQSTLERLGEYYALNPEKAPDVLYIEKELKDPRMFFSLIDTGKYELTENDTAFIFIEK